MAVLVCQISAPAGWLHVAAALDGGVVAETACVCSSVAPATITYATGGSDDVIPVLRVATVYGGGGLTTVDRDAGPWVVITVRASTQLQLVQEAVIATVTGDYARLGRICRLTVELVQQS